MDKHEEKNVEKIGEDLEAVEEIEIEAFGKRNETPPPTKGYRVRIDSDRYLFDKRLVTGRELLDKAGKTPYTRWRLHQKMHGGQMIEVGYEQEVDLGARGLERFTTFELTVGDGEEPVAPPRQVFRLPEEDEQYLASMDLPWETIMDGGARWLLILEHPVPGGYNVERVTMAVRIEGGYPSAGLDMVYFFPALARQDGKPIHALASQSIGGRTFQRWSRHYGWRAGIDSLVTHHLRIKEWLDAELKRG